MLDVCLIGCGGTFPLPNRHLTSLMARYNGHCILVDCGEGTQIGIREAQLTFKNIDVICITHFHADHISGLPGLLLTIGNSDRTEPLTIIGPRGIQSVVKSLCVIAPRLPFDIRFLEVDNTEKTFEFDGYSINAFRLFHEIECVGYSINIPRNPKFLPEKAQALDIPVKYWSLLQSGQSIEYEHKTYVPTDVCGEPRKGIKLTYVTDTRPTDLIKENARNSDLLICEGMYGDNEKMEDAIKKRHMTFIEAANIAKEADVKKLWLTHFSPALPDPENYISNAQDFFPNTELGEDGKKVTIMFEE
ncbi:MAG: ribonuclease Z [Clostridia bacterium]|nr:ribonuclease Z [Clostridia bacterium]